MTNKEFDQQKQAIYNQIIHLVNGDHDGDIEDQVELIKIQLSELQPPKPPTCATCTDMDNDGVLCAYWDYASEWGRKKEEFGCTLHSDYEVAR